MSIVHRLIGFAEEFEKEEKPLVKVEADLMDDDDGNGDNGTEKSSSTLGNVSVKRELEDDFSSIETDTKTSIKPSSCTSGDYDEWLEIQKELGVFPSGGSGDTAKSRNVAIAATSGSGSGAGTSSRSTSKAERTRGNGEYRASGGSTNATASVSSVASANSLKNTYEHNALTQDADRRWSASTDLERDLLEDADSLDDLALQTQCPTTMNLGSNESGSVNEHDDITAQVQSAIDSILNLKKRPSAASPANSASIAPTQQTSESKDTVLDQAVRSILGS